MFQRYKHVHGVTDRDLGEVAVAQRLAASLNPNAIMRKRITIEDYLAAGHICEPLRLYDYCLINDGGVCLIVASNDWAKRRSSRAVPIVGIGRADLNRGATALEPRLAEFYRPAPRAAAQASYAMASSEEQT